MKEIPLTHGKIAFVDDEDFDLLDQFKWLAIRRGYTFYAARMIGPKGNRSTILMHRVVMRCGLGEEVDHRNRDGLNNTRENLRMATRSENMRNSRRRKDNVSGFKGVSFHRSTRKWQAHIMLNQKSIYLGIFTTPEEAHLAYCQAAESMHGEFARLK